MDALDPADLHRVNAAQGWLMLGCPDEAQSELRGMSSGAEMHPAVLDLRWQAFAHQTNWAAAFAVAELLVRNHPGSPSGWIHRAYSARRMPGGGIPQAYKLLLPAADAFPDDELIPYNLACYCAQENRLEEAWTWYRAACACGVATETRARALRDEDLRPIWPMIEQLIDPNPGKKS